MKSILKFACMFVSMFAIATLSSCDPVEPAGQSPDAPTALEAGSVTDVSAVLTWSGNATAYEVIVGQGKAQSVTGKSYKAEGLTPETEYKWQVRAVDGEHASAWVDGTPFKTKATGDDPQNPEPPLNLAWSDVTDTSASFTWAGTSSTYEIKVGEKVETVSAKVHTRTGLTPDTKYQWSVRSVDAEHNLYSAWVNGKEFTTDKPVGPVRFVDGLCYYYGLNDKTKGGQWEMNICTTMMGNEEVFLPADGTGYVLAFDFYTENPFSESSKPIDIVFPAAPAGTYTFSKDVSKGAACDGKLLYYEENKFISLETVTSGTVTIKKTGGLEYTEAYEYDKYWGGYPYTIECDLVLDDETSYKIAFQGTVDVDNRTISTFLRDDLDFNGKIDTTPAITRVINEENVYAWIFEAAGGEMSYIPGLGFWGAGPFMKFEFYTEKTVGTDAIPEGEYTISTSGLPGTVKQGKYGYSEGREDGLPSINRAPFYSGKIKITKTGDDYEVKFIGVKDDVGFKVEGGYKGPVEIQAYVNQE